MIGTTDEKVADPENLRIEPWEVQLMLEEGEKLVPGISQARVLRAWAGVRPLYQEGYGGASRDATRALTLLDHRQRDGVAGFLTITGGKWTTFRLMAETTHGQGLRAAWARAGPARRPRRRCPGVEQGHYWLGHRLHEVEEHRLQGELVCECELVTRAMLENAAVQNPTLTLDDLRRDVRLGMGPCQGGFCTYRAVGILHEMGCGAAPAASADAKLRHRRRTERSGTWPTCSRPATTCLVAETARVPAGGTAARSAALNPNLAAARFPAGALEGRDADPVGPTAQAGAAGRADLPERDERRPPAR